MNIKYYYFNKLLFFIIFFNLVYPQLPSLKILQFTKHNIKSDRAIIALQVYLEKEIKSLNKYSLIQESQNMTLLKKNNFDINECDNDCIFENGRLRNIDFILYGEVIKNSVEYYLILKLFNINENIIDHEIEVKSNLGFTNLITKARRLIKNELIITLQEELIINPLNVKTNFSKVNCEKGEILLWDKCYSIKETDSLDLSGKGLKGSIPKEISKLKNLIYLDLSENDLNGVIPYQINNLLNLKYLNFDKNKFWNTEGNLSKNLNNLSILNNPNSKHIQNQNRKSESIIEKKNSSNFVELNNLMGNNSENYDNKKVLKVNNQSEGIKNTYNKTSETDNYISKEIKNNLPMKVISKDIETFEANTNNKNNISFINNLKLLINDFSANIANSFKIKPKVNNNIKDQKIKSFKNAQDQNLIIKIIQILQEIKLAFKNGFKREDIPQASIKYHDNDNSRINSLKNEIRKSKLKGAIYTSLISGGLIYVGNSIRTESNRQYELYYLNLTGESADKAKGEIKSKDKLSSILFLSGTTSALGSYYFFNLKTKSLQKKLDILENK
jgi:hypothetical protein